MAKIEHTLPEIGPVEIVRKRGQKSIKLKVTPSGVVQVSMPWLAPKYLAVNFALSKKDWILEQQAESSFAPYNGMYLAKTLRLLIMQNSPNKRTKRIGGNVVIYFDNEYDSSNAEHRAKITKLMHKALREEAERILLPRLRELADVYGFDFTSSSIKQLTGRWGSCDSKKHIVLNSFLVQLPIDYIDYVIFHELAHTQHLNHSPEFWETVHNVFPHYKKIRKQLKTMQPRLYDAKTFMA
jgi:predicted metal-dependent hydrolase